eukprot:GFUD01028722.1.p1 GENE.GFUD01028722.1~~GFUD01028722.1.p1  ORF type:complete len:265 (+),score=61.25 GFUD01028722.1:247-1041(+)
MMSYFDLDDCKFCHSNGESVAQYRSHQLKNASGLVTCPVLRSFICPFCKATGDFAHTQRYCPQNKDGKFNSGVSLTDLKKKNNAAGNYPSFRRMTWPLQSSYPGKSQTPSPVVKVDSFPSSYDYKMMNNPFTYHAMTDPLPSCYRSPSPPTMVPSQPPSAQLALYRHYQYIQYYQDKQVHHGAEIARLQAIRQADSPPCYVRNFPSPMSVSPPSSPPDRVVFAGGKKMSAVKAAEDSDEEKSVEGDVLGDLLAKLREGTEEVDM